MGIGHTVAFALQSDKAPNVGWLQCRDDDRLIAKAGLQQPPYDPNSKTARTVAQPSSTAHVLVEAAQLILDRVCLCHGRWNNTLVLQNPQQQVAAGTEVATDPLRRRRTVTAWQVAIKEPLNRRLVNVLDFKPGPTHPAREVRDGVDMTGDGVT
jgi:hypothetical protein